MTAVRLLATDLVTLEEAHGRPLKIPIPLKDPHRQIEGYCPACERTELPPEAFQWFTRRSEGVKRRMSACKECIQKRRQPGQGVSPATRTKEWVKLYPQAAKIGQLASKLRRKYSLTITKFLCTLQQQNHRCARCRSPKWGGKLGFPHIDHDHSTGAVRGLLCQWCNQMLGHLGDTASSVRSESRSYLDYLGGRL